MTVQIALLRGINVGGHNKLPMADLRDLLATLGAQDCKTYIQSGNAVYRGDLDAEMISEAIEKAHGFRPQVMVRDLSFWQARIAAAPYPSDDPKALHLFVLAGPTNATEADLNQHATPTEAAQIGAGVVYLHTPGGLSASKIADRIDRILGTQTTARNWRSVLAIRDLAASLTP